MCSCCRFQFPCSRGGRRLSCLGEAKQSAREGGREGRREEPDIPMFVGFVASNDDIDMIFELLSLVQELK